MAIPKVKPRKIVLVGQEFSIVKELPAGGTITPGSLIAMNSSGQWVNHATAKGDGLRAFAGEYSLAGKGIDDNYVANDDCIGWIVPRGAEINALVAASASAIVVGDYVESAGDGTVRKATAASGLVVPSGGGTVVLPGVIIGQALEAVDNSGNASSSARLRIVIL